MPADRNQLEQYREVVDQYITDLKSKLEGKAYIEFSEQCREMCIKWFNNTYMLLNGYPRLVDWSYRHGIGEQGIIQAIDSMFQSVSHTV
jgi:hypothetical protein